MSHLQRIKEIFLAARVLAPGPERDALLDCECGADADLRREVESLLAQSTQALEAGNGSSAGDPLPSTLSTPITEDPGTRVGPYKLLQQIGEGGFGAVWMAEQREPIKRRVALKIIKPGMDSRQVIARFEAERQALAMMDHPNIARVLDAGVTDAGRPYFVMELVRGVPITVYADTENLDPDARLELFATVCNAVQHAHQKGIIHRDLKPSNVLVTLHDGKPVPKVIDFGIAKATSGELTDKTLFTEFQQLIGTPQYMSPEQAEMSGIDIDTRSDIYSLGVLLYELLTGVTPFDAARLRLAAMQEMRRIIREEDPPRPSTRVSTLGDTLSAVARHRKMEPARLGALIRGDLDWITMKCLEKDRGRRYGTASDLAADVQRHLSGEAVIAAPPGRIYRVRKFVRRHKGSVVAASLVTLALLLGVAGTTAGVMRAQHERRQGVLARRAEEIEKEKALAAQAEATRQRNEAERQRESAEFRAYAANVSSALSAVEHGDTESARGHLQSCPERFRNWEWRHAQAATDRSLKAIKVSDGEVRVEADFPRSRILVSTADGRIKVLSWPSLEELAEFIHDQGVETTDAERNAPYLYLSPDGTRLVTRRPKPSGTNSEAPARLWDLQSSREVSEFHAPDNRLRGFLFSSDCKSLLGVAFEGTTADLWDGRTGVHRAKVDVTPAFPKRGVFTTDGSRFVLACGDGSLRVFSSIEGTEVGRLEPHATGIQDLVVSPDGRKFTTFARDLALRVWDAESLALQFTVQLEEPLSTAVQWSPNSCKLAVSGKDSIVLYDAVSGAEVVRCPVGSAGRCTLKFSPDGRTLARLESNEQYFVPKALVWDAVSGAKLGDIRCESGEGLIRLAFSPDSRTIVTGASAGSVNIWDARNLRVPTLLAGHTDQIDSILIGPDGGRILSGAKDGWIRLWDPATSARTIEVKGIRSPARFTPDSRRLVTPVIEGDWDNDGEVVFYDADAGVQFGRVETSPMAPDDVGNYPDETYRSGRVQVSADGTKIAAGVASAARAAVFDVDTGFPLGELRGPTPVPGWTHDDFGMVFSPDFTLVAVWRKPAAKNMATNVTETQQLTLADASSGRVLREWPVVPNCVAFCPDGAWLAAGLDDGVVKVWSVQSGVERFTIAAQQGDVRFVEFDATGKRLATGAPGETTAIWNVADGKRLVTLEGSGASGWDAAFAPDGSRLLLADGTSMHLWDVSTGTKVGRLRAAVGGVIMSPDQSRVLLKAGFEVAVLDGVPQAERFTQRSQLMAAQDEARRVADEALVAAGQRIQEAAQRIRGQGALDPNVRRGALDRLFAECSRRRSSVLSQYANLVFTSDVIAAIESDAALSPGVRADMIEIARRRGDHPVTLIEAAWRRVIGPDGSADDYRVGLRAAEQAMAASANSYHVYVLAVAQYRNGLYEEALRNIRRANDLDDRDGNYRPLGHTAFLAMSLFQLGRVDEARTELERLQTDMRDAGNAESEYNQALLTEVEALFEGVSALELGLGRSDRCGFLNSYAWRQLSRPDGGAEQFARALRAAESAVATKPKNADYVNTLGCALYRNGRYEDALEALTRARAIYAIANEPAQPAELAFFAMSQFKLGRVVESQASLARLREAMQNAWNAGNQESRAFANEAESLVGSSACSPASAPAMSPTSPGS